MSNGAINITYSTSFMHAGDGPKEGSHFPHAHPGGACRLDADPWVRCFSAPCCDISLPKYRTRVTCIDRKEAGQI